MTRAAINAPRERPSRPAPKALSELIADVRLTMRPVELWLFGSRARGDARPDSDWDILAVLPDDSPAELLDPITIWRIRTKQDIPITLLATTQAELNSIWGLPNTIGYDLAHEGVKLVVD